MARVQSPTPTPTSHPPPPTPNIPQTVACRRGLGAAAVWTEAQSVIKGSLAALRDGRRRGRMARDAYVALGATRAGASLDAAVRSRIYDLSEQYERAKVRPGAAVGVWACGLCGRCRLEPH
jgi:hypothetical protein